MLLLIAPPASFLYSALMIGLFSSFSLLAGFFILNRLSLLLLVHLDVALTFSPILAVTWGNVLRKVILVFVEFQKGMKSDAFI